jgi:MFS family permease
VALLLRWLQQPASRATEGSGTAPAAARSVQRKYLIVLGAFKFADWMQGPYMFDAYSVKTKSDGESLLSMVDISTLFVVGFGSSMLAGTIAGSLVDKFGRKRFTVICALSYIASCAALHSDVFATLIAGRFMSGIATSLLACALESWFVAEAGKLGFEKADNKSAWIGSVYSQQYFLDGIVAILAGFAAQAAMSAGGPLRVFQAAGVVFAVAACLVSFLWAENFGDTSGGAGANFSAALRHILEHPSALAMGVVIAAFEGSMYAFVMAWVPLVQERLCAWGLSCEQTLEEPPLGIIFAVFMSAVMVGSSAFGLLVGKGQSPVSLLASACALAVVGFTPVIFMSGRTIAALGFALFEGTVGLYFPAAGTVRAMILPEELFSAAATIYRVPLNLFVVIVLLNIERLGNMGVLQVCTLAVAAALAAVVWLRNAMAK